jgi:hypothetical protein
MSTPRATLDARIKLQTAIGIAAVAIGTLVAVGIAALFLALTGASRTARLDARQPPTDSWQSKGPITIPSSFSASATGWLSRCARRAHPRRDSRRCVAPLLNPPAKALEV